jgi:type IV secretory pathway TraG/TraD family ATPase VirD4
VRDGISLGNQRTVRPIVSYPEISELPNLSCFVRLPGSYPITKLQLKHRNREVISEALSIREMPIQTHMHLSSEINAVDLTKSEESITPRIRKATCIDEYVK